MRKNLILIIALITAGISTAAFAEDLTTVTAPTFSFSETTNAIDSGVAATTNTDSTQTSAITAGETSLYQTEGKDTIPPTIQIQGNNPLYIKQQTAYRDPGAVAYDAIDGDLSKAILAENDVNSTITGEYHVIYSVKDKAGNEAEASRTVIVVAGSATPQDQLKTTSTNTTVSTTPPSPTPIRDAIKEETRESIRTAISAGEGPEGCSTVAECKAYCADPVRKESCKTFVRTHIASSTKTIRPRTLFEFANEDNIRQTLEERKGERPGECATLADCRAYCSDPSHDDECADFLTKRKLLSESELKEKRKALANAREARIQVIKERVGARAFYDSDSDGVSDYDEVNLYDTDPYRADSDDDGAYDGDEILARTSPRSKENATVAHENPRIAGQKVEGTFSVLAISPALPKLAAASEDDAASVTREETATDTERADAPPPGISGAVSLSGVGPANSYLAVYVFSTPIVVTVKTDDQGRWVYTFEEGLADGEHEVYVAMTDGDGQILAKSDPIPFVKTAEAITIGEVRPLAQSQAPTFFGGWYLAIMIVSILAIIAVTVIFIGSRLKQQEETNF